MYKSFMNTQADLITSDRVLERVADDLIGKDPLFFQRHKKMPLPFLDKFITKKKVEPVAVLRSAINSESLKVAPERNTELIKISMKSPEPEHASFIVNSFVRAYMAIVVAEESKGENYRLRVLEDERKALSNKLQRQRRAIHELAQEYGTQSLTGRQEMMLQRVATLQQKLTEFDVEKIALKIKF